MEINVLAFGQIADITNNSVWKITGVKDSEELQSKLAEAFPALIAITYSIAINKSVIQKNTPLKNGDSVALLPPFSGG
jgi:molybdopterin synthase sulfur carrier subunit